MRVVGGRSMSGVTPYMSLNEFTTRINNAYRVLSDTYARSRFDANDVDDDAAVRARPVWRAGAVCARSRRMGGSGRAVQRGKARRRGEPAAPDGGAWLLLLR